MMIQNMQTTIKSEIREIIAELIEEEPEVVLDQAHLVKDLGVDSMSVLEFMAKLEKKFGVVIKPEFLPELVTLDQAAALMQTLLNDQH
jgi:acyl carrier protein